MKIRRVSLVTFLSEYQNLPHSFHHRWLTVAGSTDAEVGEVGGQVACAVGWVKGRKRHSVVWIQRSGQRWGELDVGQIRQGASRIERGRDQWRVHFLIWWWKYTRGEKEQGYTWPNTAHRKGYPFWIIFACFHELWHFSMPCVEMTVIWCHRSSQTDTFSHRVIFEHNSKHGLDSDLSHSTFLQCTVLPMYHRFMNDRMCSKYSLDPRDFTRLGSWVILKGKAHSA